MQSCDEKNREIAPESSKTQKAREKLRERWEKEALLVTASALAGAVQKIHNWIALNAGHRIVLREKEIHLFDQNQNAAALSRKVQDIARKVGEAYSDPSEP